MNDEKKVFISGNNDSLVISVGNYFLSHHHHRHCRRCRRFITRAKSVESHESMDVITAQLRWNRNLQFFHFTGALAMIIMSSSKRNFEMHEFTDSIQWTLKIERGKNKNDLSAVTVTLLSTRHQKRKLMYSDCIRMKKWKCNSLDIRIKFQMNLWL